MERTKRISMQTLAIAILSLLLVASVLMTATGAWFIDSAEGGDSVGRFGTILLGDLETDGDTTIFTNNFAEGDVVMPGDSIAVDFTIRNNGSADMWVKFSIAIEVTGDTAGRALAGYLTPGETLGENWYAVGEVDGLYEFAYKLPVVANLDGYVDELGDIVAATQGTVHVEDLFEFPADLSQELEHATFSVTLNVSAVQVANNYTTMNPYGTYTAGDYVYSEIAWSN